MQIAIIGAGLAGLATAYYLKKKAPDISLSIFYDEPGASTMAAGLMHPYGGEKCKENWGAAIGMQKTLALLDEIGAPYEKKGIRKIAFEEKHLFYLKQSAKLYPHLHFENNILFIPEGVSVDMEGYLRLLKEKLIMQGVSFIHKKITALEELDSFDQIVLAAGAHSVMLASLPLNFHKGQILELSYPKDHPPLETPLVGKVYLVQRNQSCFVGATYERGEGLDAPFSLEKAKELLLPDAYKMMPALRESAIIGGKRGFRATTYNHVKPFLLYLRDKVWVFSGLGSKGLLYHAWLAELLAEKIREQEACSLNTSLI